MFHCPKFETPFYWIANKVANELENIALPLRRLKNSKILFCHFIDQSTINNRKNHFSSRLRVLVFAFFEDDESYTCYKCGKIFAYESYLERHVKYVCPDKTGRTWKCSYCSKAFQYPCYLRRHMRSHTGKNL